jgi:hypothetical protein
MEWKGGNACDWNRVVVCLLPLVPVSYSDLHISEPTTVKLKLESRRLGYQQLFRRIRPSMFLVCTLGKAG